MNTLKVLLIFLVPLTLSLSFKPLKIRNNSKILKMEQDTSIWVAPDSANNLVNPYETNDENSVLGLLIYRKHCRSCHGRNGDGHGVEAADLSTVVPDFTVPSFIEQTDGSMFWKISEGRNDMKPYIKKINEEDIWLVVMYIKTLSKVSEE